MEKSLWWQLLLFESQVTSNSNTLSMLSEVKRTSPPQYKFAVDVFSELRLQFLQHLSDLCVNVEDISIFWNPFKSAVEELPPNLQWGVINLQCHAKISREDSNRIPQMPSKWWLCLMKIICLWTDISVCHYLFWERYFQKWNM